MDLSFLRSEVILRLGKRTYKSMLHFITRKRPSLWGLEKPGHFLESSLCITLYMDLYRCGVNKMVQKTKNSLGFKLSNKSVHHNVNAIRQLLAKWGARNIQLRSNRAWNRTAGRAHRPKPLQACQHGVSHMIFFNYSI